MNVTIKRMTDEERKRAIERARVNSFDEYRNYGENNPNEIKWLLAELVDEEDATYD